MRGEDLQAEIVEQLLEFGGRDVVEAGGLDALEADVGDALDDVDEILAGLRVVAEGVELDGEGLGHGVSLVGVA